MMCLLIAVQFVFSVAWAGDAPKKAADFYKGAIIKIIIPTSPGGGQDTRKLVADIGIKELDYILFKKYYYMTIGYRY